MLDHAVKGAEKEAKLVYRTTLLLGLIECGLAYRREFNESSGLAEVVSL